jgi:phage gpG-like protein
VPLTQRIDLDGVTAMEATLKGLSYASATLAMTAFPLIAADFRRMEAERFDSAGKGDWPSLRPATVDIKAGRGLPKPTQVMYGTGDLRESLTGFTKQTVYEVSPVELVVGTSAPYAVYHQDGPRTIRVFGRTPAVLPQRRIVDLGVEDAHRWAEIVATALQGGR